MGQQAVPAPRVLQTQVHTPSGGVAMPLYAGVETGPGETFACARPGLRLPQRRAGAATEFGGKHPAPPVVGTLGEVCRRLP